MNADEFRRTFDVSRETLSRLETYVELLQRWNKRINLVSSASLTDAWARHMADSAQLLALAPNGTRSWIDLGAGAGLPGLPVAALAAEKSPCLRVTLVESDRRKAVFLGMAARAMGLNIGIDTARIESLPCRGHDVVSARALAPLPRLCRLAYKFTRPGSVLLFPKGAKLDSELTTARSDWHIRLDRIASRTDSDAVILKIVELKPRS